MQTEVVDRLLDLNREFYQSFAAEFAETRRRIQPGVQRAVKRIPRDAAVLDIGCGHGELASYLNRTGFRGRYLGVDSSQSLLDLADRALDPVRFQFSRVDLSEPDWSTSLRDAAASGEPAFAFACAFAVLHHLPGAELRRRMLSEVRMLLARDGQLLLSVWDFMASLRTRSRIRPWSQIEVQPEQVEPGDTLLDWRHGGRGLRYVHHFSPPELRELAGLCGFRVVDEFRSDGENGRLGLYQTWRPAAG